MGKFATTRPEMPTGDDIAPSFVIEDNWSDKQKLLFVELNAELECECELTHACAQYLCVIMEHRGDQMMMLKAGTRFRTALKGEGYSQDEIRMITSYAERYGENDGHHTNRGMSSAPVR